jgi:hypothetical protein
MSALEGIVTSGNGHISQPFDSLVLEAMLQRRKRRASKIPFPRASGNARVGCNHWPAVDLSDMCAMWSSEPGMREPAAAVIVCYHWTSKRRVHSIPYFFGVRYQQDPAAGSHLLGYQDGHNRYSDITASTPYVLGTAWRHELFSMKSVASHCRHPLIKGNLAKILDLAPRSITFGRS